MTTNPGTGETGDSETVLIGRVGLGDHEAFSKLYDRFARPLYCLAFLILADHGESEDVIQDVFVKIWRNASSFDPSRGKPFSWVATMTRNRAIDRLRGRKRRQGTEGHLPENREAHQEEPVDTELAVRIGLALNKLPSRYQAALKLSIYGARTHRQVAREMAKPLGTVKAYIRRGLSRMRKDLQGQETRASLAAFP